MNVPGLTNPFAPFAACIQHRHLIRRLSWRRIEIRYRGSVLGLLWTIVDPLLMLAVYTFVFSVVFKARWGGESVGGGDAEFALFLFSGLIIYNVFAQCVNEAPGDMLRHRAFVQEMAFPVEVLSWVNLFVGLFNFVISFIILLVFCLFVYGLPPVTALWLPIILLPVLMGTLGLCWLLSSLGVFLRDISQVTSVVTMVMLFLSPIFYPAARVPESFRAYYALNPLAGLLEMSKGALFYGRAPDPITLSSLLLGSWLVAWVGYLWFMATKKGFADVL